MKRTFFLLLLTSFMGRAQSISIQGLVQRVNTVNELRALIPGDNATAILIGSTSLNDGTGDTFFWNPTSVAGDDGISTIQSNNAATGRWVRLRTMTVKTSQFTGTVTTGTTSYTVTHNLGASPSYVNIEPISPAASGTHRISAVTSTYFVVTYDLLPTLTAIGTAMQFYWLVRL